jgi:Asp-tRNA(Asn)/Glu-tRNA(Gln) amidotransferase A subunit family amidase
MNTMALSIDFRNLPVATLHGLISSGEVTFLELAETCIAQTEKFQDRFYPWVCFDAGLLRDQAHAAQRRFAETGELRALEGIPLAVKDIYNTKNFPTEMGSPLWKGFTPGNDARVVYQAKEAGALIPGKTVTAEFAVHALNETLNPHDISRTPGTSSSGSAVAVALGMVPVALGSQTAGSIMRPASFCGIYGFKPSFGTIPRTGTLKTTDSLDTLGFFTASPADCVRVFDAIRVHGRNYPFVHRTLDDPSRQQKPGGEPWRVALIRTHTWDAVPDYAKSALETWAGQLEKYKITVCDVELPETFLASHSIHSTIYNFSLAYYFEEESGNAGLVSPVMNHLIEAGRKIGASAYHKALRAQETLCREIDALLADYDAVISLSTAGSAPLRDVEELPDPSLIWTLTHLPSLSAPAFQCPEGLPFGVQISGRRFRDYRLLDFVGYLVQSGHLPACPRPLLQNAQR